MKLKTFRKGQGTLEYAIIIVVVVGALLAMQWYIKGGYQGKLRQAADDMGEQYSPTLVSSNTTTYVNAETNEVISGGSFNTGVMPTSRSEVDQSQQRLGSETLDGLNGVNVNVR